MQRQGMTSGNQCEFPLFDAECGKPVFPWLEWFNEFCVEHFVRINMDSGYLLASVLPRIYLFTPKIQDTIRCTAFENGVICGRIGTTVMLGKSAYSFMCAKHGLRWVTLHDSGRPTTEEEFKFANQPSAR